MKPDFHWVYVSQPRTKDRSFITKAVPDSSIFSSQMSSMEGVIYHFRIRGQT